MIYDFYGFPKEYYKYNYPNVGSPKIAERVLGLLKENGIKAEGTNRGLDHGVWVPFAISEFSNLVLRMCDKHY
jgi:4,5-DOPA dioxygenase extradiol